MTTEKCSRLSYTEECKREVRALIAEQGYKILEESLSLEVGENQFWALFNKFARSRFERTKCGPEGVKPMEGRNNPGSPAK
jgi:hypothetical protein